MEGLDVFIGAFCRWGQRDQCVEDKVRYLSEQFRYYEVHEILTAWGQVTTHATPAEPQPYPRAPEDLNSKCEPHDCPRVRFEIRQTLLFTASTSLFHCIVQRPLLLLSASPILQTKRVLVLLTEPSNSAQCHFLPFTRMPLLLPRDGDSNFHSFSTVYEHGQVKSGWAFCMSKAYCKYATLPLQIVTRP